MYKLEELLTAIKDDLILKNEKMSGRADSDMLDSIINNNRFIINNLEQCIAVQQQAIDNDCYLK